MSSAASQHVRSSTLDGAPPLIMSAASVPASMLCGCAEYSFEPVDSAAWLQRHRDSPAAFRSARYLFGAEQLCQLDDIFKSGWKLDPGHPMLSCIGLLRRQDSSADPVDARTHAL